MSNYTILHLHTDLSTATTNIDSVTKSKDYIQKASSLGMTSIAFTEHGNILNWAKKKELCEEYGLKYIHGIEAYLTITLSEKIRDNYHCCLYAKNYEGVKELNKLITKSFDRQDNHFYYTPRITLDELESTSENIIITSACIGGIFGKGSKDIQDRYLNFFIKNKDRCYLEIQHHLDDIQVELNKKLYKLSKENGLKLVVGTDTHALNEIHAKGRTILQKAKNIKFDNESSWDIIFKTYDELIEMYKKQDAIPMNEVRVALENTNKIANEIETFEINKEYKYPKLWDNPEYLLNKKIEEGINKRHLDQLDDYESKYIPRIKEELETYKHNKAIDFLLLDEDIKSYGKKNNKYPGYSRGSVSGSLISYIIGMTDMDSIKHDLNFQRFMNVERVSLADVDTDWSPEDREFIKQYIYNKEGLYCADIITFNTVALKGSIRDVCRALYTKEVPQWIQDRMDSDCKGYGKPTDATAELYKRYKDGKYLEIADDICKNIELNEKEYREKYKDVFEYVDIINGTVVSVGTHPCGLICSPIPLDENVGLMTLSTCDYPVSMLNMKEIDSQNFVKLDLLGLDNVTLINKTCELVGIERLTPDNVNDDEEVWMSIRENTLGIFQWEGTGERYIKDLFSDETLKRIRKINPNFRYIDLFSVGNGAIRPAGASYREELAKGIFKDNGHDALNEFLSPTLGYLVYQEQIIEFLNKFCGYSMGAADIVRRGFAKKTGTEQHIPKIKDGFIKTMKEKYNVSKEESEKIIVDFLQVIMDASSYLFSLNHSESYSYIGYICGYLRYYYPLEFLSVALNIYKDDIEKTKKIVDYANERNIKIKPPKFRYSRSEYFMDKKTNSIYKGIQSIKYLNESIGEFLYSLRDNKYKTFTELLIDLNGNMNSKQLTILIKLDFFSEFGKSKKLMDAYENFSNIYGKKQLDKAKYSDAIFVKYARKETEKKLMYDDTVELLKSLERKIPNEDMKITERIQAWYDYVGSCELYDKSYTRECLVLEIDNKYATKCLLHCINNSHVKWVKVGKKMFKNNKFEVGDVLYLSNTYRKQKKKKTDNGFIDIEGFDVWSDEYWKIEI
ncbi:PHP domain-containing protein [Terrisporobacter sp.]|uniref:PHP domain-containing protein n=1 Tax=Terrisporobacter sp. TaxID=1965305 RepID=UPI002897511B|nr:PHP domain-containing protein [Terrisporobacter sp.]